MAADAGGGVLGRDPFSQAGKFAPPAERFDVVVIGAGAAGIAAAGDARAAGASVLLVDENPLSPGLIGMDVPLFWGGRASGATQAPARLEEQVLRASPGLEALFEAGVEVRLRTIAWGAYVNGPALRTLPEPVVGLADDGRSWLCGFRTLIVAAGARDLVLSFPGWDQPGVMGALALQALLVRYEAFAGRRLVVLGTGRLALATARLALERGLDVAALVEARDAPQGPSEAVAALEALGTPVLIGCAPEGVRSGPFGVEALRLGSTIDPAAAPFEIACDTVCLAIGEVPAVELLGAMGAPLAFDPFRGGHVPVLSAEGETGVRGVFARGACAGIPPGPEGADYALDWMKALLALSSPDVELCQCEAVSRAALLSVRPPAYLGPPPEALRRRSLQTLAADGPLDLDQIKRLTRAGMGPCQGRRCREQVALTLAAAAGVPLSDLPLTGYRAPVRPLPLEVLADAEETAEMAAGWDVWFGVPSQWIPDRDVGGPREAMHVARLSGAEEGP
jgi:thioredoxin reductase